MGKIYTKTGDKGETSLFGGKRISKADLRVEAYGTVDELNSAVGVTIAHVLSSKYKVLRVKKELIVIQNDLLLTGSLLSNPSEKPIIHNTKYIIQRVDEFEKQIDEMTKELPELRNFILPGGGIVGSQLHFARTLTRRAERKIVELSKKENVNGGILMYFNRLSDLFFTMARFVNHKEKQKETIWKNK